MCHFSLWRETGISFLQWSWSNDTCPWHNCSGENAYRYANCISDFNSTLTPNLHQPVKPDPYFQQQKTPKKLELMLAKYKLDLWKPMTVIEDVQHMRKLEITNLWFPAPPHPHLSFHLIDQEPVKSQRGRIRWFSGQRYKALPVSCISLS